MGWHVRHLKAWRRRVPVAALLTALAEYAATVQLHWVDDVSNRDLRPARNYLRHRVWPVLMARWPDASGRLSEVARHAAEARTLLDQLAREDLNCCRPQGAILPIPRLLYLSRTRQRNLLRYWVRAQGLPPPPEARLNQLLWQIHRPPRTRRARIDWPGAEVHRYRDLLFVRRPPPASDPEWHQDWDVSVPLSIPGTGLRLGAVPTRGAGLKQTSLKGKLLQVRFRRGGEVCRLPGRRHHHRLKKLMQQAGVPPWERERLPLLYVNGELAAVADRWICEPFMAHAGEPGLLLVLEHAAGNLPGGGNESFRTVPLTP